MTNLEIEAAVEAARRTGGGFVFVNENGPPELIAALAAFANESGRELLRVPGESETLKAARAAAARDIPVVSRGDDSAFLSNLADIAAGKVKVA